MCLVATGVWSAGQGTNITSACFLSCLYETLLGNSSAAPPVPPMTREAIMAPFVRSFESKDGASGGCPDVHQELLPEPSW